MSQLRIIPAKQGFHGDHPACFDAADRLVVQRERILLQRTAEASLDVELSLSRRVHRLREELVVVPSAAFCPVHRHVRVPDERLGVLPVEREDRDSNARGYRDFAAIENERLAKCLEEAPDDRARAQSVGQLRDQKRELVTAQPRDRLLQPVRFGARDGIGGSQILLQSLGDLDKATREDHSQIMNTMIRFYASANEAERKQAMAFELSPFDEKLLKFGKLFRERFMDIRVSMPVIEALDRCWETLAECFEPQELLMKQGLIDKYYPKGKSSESGEA